MWGKGGGLQKGICLMRRARRTLFVKGLAVLLSVCVEYVIDVDVLTVIAE